MTILLVGLGLIVCMVFITHVLINSLTQERFQSVMRLLIPAYLLINLYLTILMREPAEDSPVILVPLHAFFGMFGWDVREFSDFGRLLQGAWSEPVFFTLAPMVGVAQNLVLFVPFGFLLCAASKQPHMLRILLMGLLLSLCVELCQMLFQLGWFEVDDILHNTLGTYLGICLYRWMVKHVSTPK